ncbi:MAG: DUF5106 domain-containing protein [Prevotella sp.]|nr:DUF5106 domain-containing protein [Prevotella sp.]
MRKAALTILAFITAMAVCGQTRSGMNAPGGTTADESARPAELPLPSIPQTLTAPEDRAAYLTAHFWDAMDFADTTLTADRTFMEQNFANFVSVFPALTPQALKAAVSTLMTRASASTAAYRTLTDIAEKYLYDPNSPMLNEEHYIAFLEETAGSPLLSEAERSKQAFNLRCALKNRQGTVAADFSYTDRQGRHRTLHTTEAETLMLIFYDPDCEHCTEMMDKMKGDTALHDAVTSGSVKVLAIYSDGDRPLWDKTKGGLPAEWTVGFDTSGIQEHGTYILRAMPTVYILDAGKTVIAKDFPAERF